jgi:hypothetical protein
VASASHRSVPDTALFNIGQRVPVAIRYPAVTQWRFGSRRVDAADRYVKEAERCERLAEQCVEEASRAFFMDAAARWRQMALEAEHTEPPPRRGPEGPTP